MNFDLNDVRHPSQFSLLEPDQLRFAESKLIQARANALRKGDCETQNALQVLNRVLNEVSYLAANYTNLYDVTRKAISENQFLTKQINDRTNSET